MKVFNPDLAVVVRKEFNGSKRVTTGQGKRAKEKEVLHTYKPGDPFPWKEMGIMPDRVASMLRSGYVDHTSQPYSRSMETQKKRLAERKKGVKAAKPKKGKAPPELQAPRPRVKLERTYEVRNKIEDEDDED